MSDASADRPRLYGRETCSDTTAARAHLDGAGFAYQWIDIDEDEQGRCLVRELNGGYESTPVLLLPDGRFFREPSAEDLRTLTQP